MIPYQFQLHQRARFGAFKMNVTTYIMARRAEKFEISTFFMIPYQFH